MSEREKMEKVVESLDLEEQMLDALELLHYAHRFRDSRFAFVLSPNVPLSKIELDLRLIQSARIEVLILCASSDSLKATLDGYRARGAKFVLINANKKSLDLITLDRSVEEAFRYGMTPIVTTDASSVSMFDQKIDAAFNLAKLLSADKLFLIGETSGISVDGVLKSHLTLSDLAELLEKDALLNLDKTILSQVHAQSSQFGGDVVLLEAKPGNIYQEIFTHRGCGTLLSSDYKNSVRRARLDDTHDISMLMKPFIKSGAILPIDEDIIAGEIESFYLYTVNDQIVAAAKLTDYGDSSEIGKIVTFPRYQGRGRARKLINYLTNKAKNEGKQRVFSLSVSPVIWELFTQLGFKEEARENFPEAWKVKYDFSRPSKGFVKDL